MNLTASTAPHQKRAGVERRERTRALLIRSAIEVFARLGPDAPVVDDFIAAAGVARGTFYNYFKTAHELLAAVTLQLNEEVLGMVDPHVLRYDDPAARFCIGTRLYVHFALRYPVWGAFLTRIGPAHAVRGRRLDRFLTRDVELGIASGRFSAGSALVVRDMVLGSVFFGIETMLTEGAGDRHIEDMLATLLHGIGLPADEARRLAHLPLPELGPVSSPVFATLKTVQDN
ncbi:TetR/AcrR family transcriptional regulator [Duganella callida]|uniref:TetR/AcrR family transcriptional regulator n=1 Tax=Duganella callida TaxID=2561932 RepID=A0A4Y9RWZ9_9BURK|nr:TetR/AcrR family transcriptional regulator [Duganella callida]TFW13670.1 TetR/AcrR family transcriptional regulator [Duganella callida]